MFIIIKYASVYSFFVFLFTFSVHAVTPVPTQFLNIPQPGISCGDAQSHDPQIVKCCKMPINSPDLITAQFRKNAPPLFRGAVVDTIADQINKNAAIMHFTRTQIKEQPCMVGVPSTPGDTNNDKCICLNQPSVIPTGTMKPICASIDSKSGEKGRCEACADSGGYWSSLGCFSGNLSEFISQKILGTGVGIAGGISLLCIMFAAFQMQTSSGNAEKVKKAQEMMTNCITGLMIIIFSILILKIIGVDLLKIPGFN